MKFIRRQSGDTIVEVAIALAILTSILTTAINISTLSYRVGTSSRERTEAVSLAQQQAEMLRQYRDVQQAQPVSSYPISIGAPWHMVAGSPAISPAGGEGTASSGLYHFGITNGPGPPASAPALRNYVIRVHWQPALGNSVGLENEVIVKLTLADRKNFVLRQCEDATLPECSNLVYP